MVNGVAQLHRRLQAIPPRVEAEVRREFARVLPQVASQMDAISPLPGVIDVDWTEGKAPAGSARSGAAQGGGFDPLMHSVRLFPDGSSEVLGVDRGDGVRATLYATARTSRYPGGFPAVARWFEFGTGPRFQRTTGRYSGVIVAQPYFFPVYRAERRRIRSAITRAVRRAFQKS
jgi:hypothetical protein